MNLTYQIGDALNPIQSGQLLLVHNCNNLGVFGAGIAYSIRNKWPHVYQAYNDWCNNKKNDDELWVSSNKMCLGDVQIVDAQENIDVVNIIGQKDCCDIYNIPPVRYEAIREGLYHLRYYISKLDYKANIISPRFSAGLSGGIWSETEKLIIEVFDKEEINWSIYDLSERK